MIALTYKKLNEVGVRYLPFPKEKPIQNAINRADYLYKQGYLNVRVVEIKENIIYEPEVR